MKRLHSLNFAVVFIFLLTKMVFPQTLRIDDTPNVYLDCWRCDRDYIRTEIEYVNYVTQRQDADIHILFTEQQTGAGGREYSLTFIGQNNFLGVNDTLVFTTTPTDTRDQTRQKMVWSLKLGLVPYLSKTSIAENLSISFIKPREYPVQMMEDRWKNWVFRVSMSSWLYEEETRQSIQLRGGLDVNRVTEDWKINFSINSRYNEDNFNYDGDSYSSIRRDNGVKASVIRSLTNHWSVGVRSGISSETFRNIDLGISFGPGIEYNIFPYSQSTRRQLRFTYTLGPKYTNYTEETIFGKEDEKTFSESLTVSFDLEQPWGGVNSYLTGSHYFHDIDKKRVQFGGRINLNLVRGLSLNISGKISMINDQLYLPAAGATLEEILLQRKQLATQYDYQGSIGFSYTFGSIYSNIVNPRFGRKW